MRHCGTVIPSSERNRRVVTTASRVVLGEHFPTDVVGAMAGILGVGLVVAALTDAERPADRT